MRQRMQRSYEQALKILESRRRQTRPANFIDNGTSPIPVAVPRQDFSPTVRGIPSLVGMKEWLQQLGYSDSHLDRLNIIHVAGTKGKGSTCAFVRSFLQQHGRRTGFPSRVGLYTSPDLTSIRERIQIDDKPIGEDLFARYFFEVWDKLSADNTHSQPSTTPQMLPRFLQMLALVAFHTFAREGMDAAVIETHHGGEYDATNVVKRPKVTAITSIGMDHIEQLGPTMENVAWHKSGIFKSGAAAFAARQDATVEAVLRSRAAEKGVKLSFIDVDATLPEDALSLQAPVQRMNSSLAIAISNSFLESTSPNEDRRLTVNDISNGVEHFSWPGRFEILVDGNNQWFLDGAHNELSIGQAAEWFVHSRHLKERLRGTSGIPVPQILIFTHISDYRDGPALLECLARALIACGSLPQYVVFTTYQERLDGSVRIGKYKNLKKPEAKLVEHLLATYTEIWKRTDPEAVIALELSIEGALNFAKNIGAEHGGMQCFITGSLHLVGGALHFLRPVS